VHERQATACETAHGLHVDLPGPRGLALARVEIVKRRAVDDQLGVGVLVGARERPLVADVELFVRIRAGVVPEQGGEVRGQLARAARDQGPHRTAEKESSTGLTSCSSSSQRML